MTPAPFLLAMLALTVAEPTPPLNKIKIGIVKPRYQVGSRGVPLCNRLGYGLPDAVAPALLFLWDVVAAATAIPDGFALQPHQSSSARQAKLGNTRANEQHGQRPHVTWVKGPKRLDSRPCANVSA